MMKTKKIVSDISRERRRIAAILDLIKAIEDIIDRHKLDAADVIVVLNAYLNKIISKISTVRFARAKRL